MQDGDDAHRAIGEFPPIDVVMLVTAIIAIDTEIGGDRTPEGVSLRDTPKACEESANIAFRLILAPSLLRVGEDFVKPLAGDP